MAYFVWLLFSFRGRIGRAQYALATAVHWSLIAVVLASSAAPFMSPSFLLFTGPSELRGVTVLATALLLAFLVTIAGLWISAALQAKRLHDLGHSGWWVAAILFVSLTLSAGGPITAVPMMMFNVFVATVLSLAKGLERPNMYGMPPIGLQMPTDIVEQSVALVRNNAARSAKADSEPNAEMWADIEKTIEQQALARSAEQAHQREQQSRAADAGRARSFGRRRQLQA
ncbi:MAG: DUF805 domain-containing protein [Pseudomonadota bacterium]